jgi:(1->4)-alpha-D-glucan 1-alpha-D-glucosylmutase
VGGGWWAPTRNDEYLLYQTLLGSFPEGARGEALAAYRDRVVAYMQKACREAKVHTSWANTNAEYEKATSDFVAALLDDSGTNAFLEDFRAALKPVAWAGYLNSLGMVAVKLTSPGVPDTYQGNELWDFSLVDPDNRRPVDYAKREAVLRELQALGQAPGAATAKVFEDLPHGRAKMYVLSRLLQLRREREDLFRDAGYTIVRARGAKARNVVAYARRHNGGCVVAVVPRLTVGLGVAPGQLPCGAIWEDTRIELPFLDGDARMSDVITGREVRLEGGSVTLASLLDVAPVAVLST